MDLQIKNKKVFITASSAGIGFACAKSFLSEGAEVIINGKKKDKLEKSIKQLAELFPNSVIHGICGDMSKEQDIIAARKDIEEKCSGLDILVGNLGTGKGITVNKLHMDEWYHMYEYNLFSAVRLVDEFDELLKKSQSASIVLLSSLAGYDKIGAPIAYASAKNGIRTLIKYLADEYASYGIRVNGVAPGNVFYSGGRWEEILLQDRKGTKEYIQKSVPMKRFGMPEEIADTIVFLASERASFITGEIIKIDGGQSRMI